MHYGKSVMRLQHGKELHENKSAHKIIISVNRNQSIGVSLPLVFMSAENWMVDQPPVSANVQQISHMDHI